MTGYSRLHRVALLGRRFATDRTMSGPDLFPLSRYVTRKRSSRTSIINTSVSGCTDYAMTAEDDNTLTIHSVDLENNFGGLGITSSSNVDVRNSIFNNNSTDGLDVTTTNSFFGANTALGNGECDAFEDPSSSGDVWASNTFGKTCGSVPAAH